MFPCAWPNFTSHVFRCLRMHGKTLVMCVFCHYEVRPWWHRTTLQPTWSTSFLKRVWLTIHELVDDWLVLGVGLVWVLVTKWLLNLWYVGMENITAPLHHLGCAEPAVVSRIYDEPSLVSRISSINWRKCEKKYVDIPSMPSWQKIFKVLEVVASQSFNFKDFVTCI